MQGKGQIESLKDYYMSTYNQQTTLEILSAYRLINFPPPHIGNDYISTWDISKAKITVTTPDNEVIQIAETPSQGGSIKLSLSGTYQIRYSGETYHSVVNAGAGGGGTTYEDFAFHFNIAVIENHLPLKQWTITSVINRLLDIAEPLRKGEKPRFRLNGMRADGTMITPDNVKEGEEVGQAYKFDSVLSPEFSFTKQTLRECLQEIGKVIHGEPRLKPVKYGEENYYYEVSFDMYAERSIADISHTPYASKHSEHTLENYAGWVDSNVENLINQIDSLGGQIVEPYVNGAKSVRTEQMYVRITDGNMIIQTQYPIYTIKKVEYIYKVYKGLIPDEIETKDITPYVFEKTQYDTQLKSYEEAYPYSKAYGIYYTQGQNNIYGLNFKVDDAVLPAFQNYAIVNIINKVGGKAPSETTYPKMCFRVTYTPIYNARVRQTKSYYKDFPRPASLIYNQQANVVDNRAYGENLKGAIARLGNVEFTKTYILWELSQIPTAGQLYNKDYYISVVLVEILPTCIKCTIGLSKDFNRLSQYIGISSVKRYYEVSERQSQERNVLYPEFVVIGDKETPDDTLMGPSMLFAIINPFKPNTTIEEFPISHVTAWGTSKKGKETNVVDLPVISSAFGNSMSFSWKYADNYSAGDTSERKANAVNNGSGEVTGYFQNSYAYCDYYGRIYYYHFSLNDLGNFITTETIKDLPYKLPAGERLSNEKEWISTTIKDLPYIMRKDSREALQVNYQIDFVTNRENLIIGSALARNCTAIRGSAGVEAPKVYVFAEELNKFTDKINVLNNIDLSSLPSATVSASVPDDNTMEVTFTLPAEGKAWAIITPQTIETVDVEDEDGEPTQQKIYKGGELLIGENIEFSKFEEKTIYFTPKHEIFDKTVWYDKK